MIVLYLLLIFTLSVLAQDCNPLYQRLFYDPSPAPELKVDMVVMFNTLSPCPDAYVSVQYRNSKDEFPCKADLVSIDGPQVPYLQHYVHNCQIEIDSASPVSEFTYSIRPASKVTHAIELASPALPFRIIVTANTNMLNQSTYKPFAEAFGSLLSRREEEVKRKQGENQYRINGIVINGGFANGFAGNKGQNYNRIMRMISQYSHKWPLFINLGPAEIIEKADFALIEKSFVLGAIGRSETRTPMQGYSFAQKANLVFLETSSQFYNVNATGNEQFNRTLKALDSFLAKNQQNGNEFSIVFNRFSLFCSNQDPRDSIYNCEKGRKNLGALKDLLSSSNGRYAATDLYVGAYQNNYERTYPYRNGNFMTLEQSRYKRGDFINVNEGTGGLGLTDPLSKTQKVFTVVRTTGKAGFGVLTIKGNGELKKKNETAVIEKQMTARRIYEREKHMAQGKDQNILNDNYLKNEDLNELDLFLLNYKHIAIDSNAELVVEDVFRIVTDPQKAADRHQLSLQQ